MRENFEIIKSVSRALLIIFIMSLPILILNTIGENYRELKQKAALAEEYEKQIRDYGSEIYDLENQIEELENQILHYEDEVWQLENEISDYEYKIAIIEEEFGEDYFDDKYGTLSGIPFTDPGTNTGSSTLDKGLSFN